MGAHRSAREHTGKTNNFLQRLFQMPNKGTYESLSQNPTIKAQSMNLTNLPSADDVSGVLFFVMLLLRQILFY